MKHTFLYNTGTHIYYEIDGKCYFIKESDVSSDRVDAIINVWHTFMGNLLTVDNCPVDCPAEIAHKYLS